MQKVMHHIRHAISSTKQWFVKTWQRHWVYKTLLSLCIVIGIALLGLYGVSRWYLASHQNKPFQIGVTFIPAYARALGIEPQATMDALINEVGVRQFRLTSYWNQIEHTKGQYDFSELDWQFRKAEAVDAKISLAIGLRQPRWPECHTPDWAKGTSVSSIQPQLDAYITAVVNRYKSSPSLASYQLENEYFNNFGECNDFSRDRLVHEYDLVKKLDDAHQLIITRSNNYPGVASGQPQPDQLGVSIYRRIWDKNVTKAYFNYPLPAWYYGGNAGVQKIVTGKDSVIHELQMEPWPPEGKFITDISVTEQDKSMSASMFAERVKFAKNTGMRSADMWGAEWWYYRKVVKQDPSLWNEAKKSFSTH